MEKLTNLKNKFEDIIGAAMLVAIIFLGVKEFCKYYMVFVFKVSHVIVRMINKVLERFEKESDDTEIE